VSRNRKHGAGEVEPTIGSIWTHTNGLAPTVGPIPVVGPISQALHIIEIGKDRITDRSLSARRKPSPWHASSSNGRRDPYP
jgi:hypothetical protein